MKERKSVFLLIATMITTCLIVAVITITLLYRTAIEEERARLMETAQFQARLIEATARFNAVYSKNYPGGPNPATLSQIIDAHDHETAVAKTEIVLSKKEGESIIFLLRHRHKNHTTPAPVPFESKGIGAGLVWSLCLCLSRKIILSRSFFESTISVLPTAVS